MRALWLREPSARPPPSPSATRSLTQLSAAGPCARRVNSQAVNASQINKGSSL